VADEYRLRDQVSEGFEVVLFRLAEEEAQLSEVFVDHDDIELLLSLAVGDEDLPILLGVARVELLLEPHSGSVGAADLLVDVDDVSDVPGGSRPVDERQLALLHDGSALLAIALELNDEEPDLALELLEHLLDSEDLVLGRALVRDSLLDTGDHPVEVERSIERPEGLLVVRLRVELEDTNDQLRDVLELHVQLDRLINSEDLLVDVSKAQDDLLLYLFELLGAEPVFHIHEALVGQVHLHLLLDLSQEVLREVLAERIKATRILVVTQVLQVLRDHVVVVGGSPLLAAVAEPGVGLRLHVVEAGVPLGDMALSLLIGFADVFLDQVSVPLERELQIFSEEVFLVVIELDRKHEQLVEQIADQRLRKVLRLGILVQLSHVVVPLLVRKILLELRTELVAEYLSEVGRDESLVSLTDLETLVKESLLEKV